MRVASLVMIILISPAVVADSTVPGSPPRAKSARPVGYIVPAKHAHEFYLIGPIKEEPIFFTPTQREVDGLEERLAVYLKSINAGYDNRLDQRLPLYARQYVGVVLRGHRCIW